MADFQHVRRSASPMMSDVPFHDQPPAVDEGTAPGIDDADMEDSQLNSQIWCAECGRDFENLAGLATHEPKCLPERPEKCPVPTCEYHTEGFEFRHQCARHVLAHYETPIVCKYCSSEEPVLERSYQSGASFKRHIDKTHNPFIDEEWPCPVCAEGNFTVGDLSVHLDYCVIKQFELVDYDKLNDEPPTPNATAMWETPEPLAKLQINIRAPLHPITDNIACNAESSQLLKPSSRRKHPATFSCTLCSKSFTRAFALRAHINNHKGVRPFDCNVCGLSFTRNHDRKTHEATHSGERRYVCPTAGCGRQFSRAANLKRHQRGHSKAFGG